MYADLAGRLFLLEREVQSAFQNVVSNVLEVLGIASNRSPGL